MQQKIPERNAFINKLTGKGFVTINRGGSHLGLILVDEDRRKTGVSTGVCIGGRNKDKFAYHWNKIARELRLSSSELLEYNACKISHVSYLQRLREKGEIKPRGE